MGALTTGGRSARAGASRCAGRPKTDAPVRCIRRILHKMIHRCLPCSDKLVDREPVRLLDSMIRAVCLEKRYRSGDGDLVIFRDLNLEIARGERIALVGESGAGKSTLLHLLGGLDRPTEGAIYFGQNDICQFSPEALAEFRNRELGFVWQIHSLLAEFTALENVMMPLLIRGQSREQAEPVSLARLDEVGLRNRATHRAGELSGGEQQRVVLARALVGNPGVLLADEPTGSLDFRTGEMIMGLIEDLHRARRLTSIHATHNLEFARRADRILKLERGGLRESAPSSKCQSEPM
jgi:lipoprotein-releasing system ATP-binding protein